MERKKSVETLDKVEATGGWHLEGRIQEMHGRMTLPDMDRTVDHFSGGEVKRLAMAQLFIEEPDLILMDEPTNHLDLDIIEWLEEYQRTVICSRLLKDPSLYLSLLARYRLYLNLLCFER